LAAAGFSRFECIYSTLDSKKYSSQFYNGRLFPLGSATRAHDVKRRENYVMFLNGGHLQFAKLFHKLRKIKILKKNTCQKVVAMVTSKLMEKDSLQQIFSS